MNLRKDRTSEICQKFAVVGFGGIVFVFLIGKEYFTYLMMTKTKINNPSLCIRIFTLKKGKQIVTKRKMDLIQSTCFSSVIMGHACFRAFGSLLWQKFSSCGLSWYLSLIMNFMYVNLKANAYYFFLLTCYWYLLTCR